MSKRQKERKRNLSSTAVKKDKRGPGDYWPWKATIDGPGDAWPWKPLGFEGFSEESPGWYAWQDTMPNGPSALHVVGDVLVSNPGVSALLTMRISKDTPPGALALDLSLIQQPGIWPQVMAHVQTKFDRYLPATSKQYASVEVYLSSVRIVLIDHIDASS